MSLYSCQMCGKDLRPWSQNIIGAATTVTCICAQCAQNIAAWNRRTPEPGKDGNNG